MLVLPELLWSDAVPTSHQLFGICRVRVTTVSKSQIRYRIFQTILQRTTDIEESENRDIENIEC